MLNYWITKIFVMYASPHVKWSDGKLVESHVDLHTSLGNDFRCRVTEDGMLWSGRLNKKMKGLDLLLDEKEWEVAERYAEKLFFKAGLLKEKVWD